MNIITSNFFLAVSRVKLVDEPNIAFSLVNEGKINSWIPDYIIKPLKKKKKKAISVFTPIKYQLYSISVTLSVSYFPVKSS